VAGRELRTGWRGLLVIAVLAALVGGVAAGAVALGRRTATASSRLTTASGVPDAEVTFLSGTPADLTGARRVAGLPQVSASWVAGASIGRTEGPGINYVGLASGPPRPAGLFHPVVVAGRPPNPDVPLEVEVSEGFAQFAGVRPGSTVVLRLLTPAQAGSFSTGIGTPGGPTVALTVTALYRDGSQLDRSAPILAGPAFYARYGASASGGEVVMVRLRPGSRAAFTAGVNRVFSGQPGGTSILQLNFPADSARTVVQTGRFLDGGLLVFALGVALAGLVAVGQALARRASAGASAQRIEATLGLTTAQRVAGRALPAAAAGLIAAAGTVVGVLLAGRYEPFGSVRTIEPHPGWAPNVAIAVVAAAIALLLLVGLAAVLTWRAGRPQARRTERAPRPLMPIAPAWGLLGVRMAVGGSGGGPSTGRSSRIGAILGVTGVVAAFVAGASLSRLTDDPARWGWQAQFAVVDARPPVIESLGVDSRVRSVNVVTAAFVTLRGADVRAYAITPVKGSDPGWRLVAGRLPSRPGEVTAGTAVARRLRLHPGDLVVGTAGGTLRVVGVGVGPVLNNEGLGDAVVLTAPDLQRMTTGIVDTTALVHTDSDRAAAAIESSLAGQWELEARTAPPEIANLSQLGGVPVGLAVFLIAISLAAFAHGMAQTARNRAGHLAVLRTLGQTRRQTATAMVTAATVTMTIALAVGLPVGIAVGRLVWWAVARTENAPTAVSLPFLRLSLLMPAAELLAATIAVLAAARIVRRGPASALRTD
jgi:hypothetical protein